MRASAIFAIFASAIAVSGLAIPADKGSAGGLQSIGSALGTFGSATGNLNGNGNGNKGNGSEC